MSHETPSQLLPQFLFRSFLTVISSFLFGQFLMMMVMLFLGYFFFNDFFEFARLDDAQRAAILETDPTAGTPPDRLRLGIVIVAGVLFVALGYFIYQVAPFSRGAHGFFVAALMFTWLLQGYISADGIAKLYDLAYMIVFPSAIMIGVWLATQQSRKHDDRPTDLNSTAEN